jgi:hypothetical protein
MVIVSLLLSLVELGQQSARNNQKEMNMQYIVVTFTTIDIFVGIMAYEIDYGPNLLT